MDKKMMFMIGLCVVSLLIGFLIRNPKITKLENDYKLIKDSLQDSNREAEKILQSSASLRDSLLKERSAILQDADSRRKKDSLEILHWKGTRYIHLTTPERQKMAIKLYEDFHRTHPNDSSFN